MSTELNKKSANGIFTVKNIRGIHTRPATEIVKCMSGFKSNIKLYYHKQEANAKSLLGIIMLAAAKGAKIKIKAEGKDAEAAVNSLIELANKNFNIHY